ncbi:E3 ubiquitin-protein ligase RBBP6-like [Cheilinus undulatus]|uniref:E3 ubiquitin-protein ligase RBBP6-like n=1 Tax=Cheilinus undulatus TaxID=241271 RepID=UPI001BD69C6F|nr:E3 ubiquitin-protein ligase RBBP6-like [Cheilinus undulatus]
MTHVHYKFFSAVNNYTALFDWPNITLMDLKSYIMDREKLRFSDLQVTDAQTKQEYKDDDALIPRGSSVIVRRIPRIGAKVRPSPGSCGKEPADFNHPKR